MRGVGAHSLVTHLDQIMSKDVAKGTLQKLCTMEALLSYLPTFESTEAQDVIFCVTSLAKNSLGLEPDYSRSAVQTYKKAIEAIVAASKSMNIICRPWAKVLPTDSAPSWIPRLSNYPFMLVENGRYIRTHADILVGPPDRHVYNASQNRPAKVWFENDEEYPIMVTAGMRIGRIARLAEPAAEGLIPKSWLDLEESASYSVWSKAAQDEFWHTLVAGRNDRDEIPPSWMGLCLKGPERETSFAFCLAATFPSSCGRSRVTFGR